MKYARTALRTTALSVKADWEQSYKDAHAKKTAEYKKAHAKWEATSKPQTVAVLAAALADAKKGNSVDFYALRNNINDAPAAPAALDCCTPTTKKIDNLVELLDTLTEDEITSTSLRDAGFKDMASMLRRPC